MRAGVRQLQAQASAFDAEQVLAVIDADARAQLPRQSVKVSARVVTLGGASALVAPPAPPPIRTYVLWGVLVTGALILAALALRMLRKLG